jgi:hypothetical protein
MERIRLKTNDAPAIHVTTINQSLSIRGWDRDELRADGDIGNSLTVSQDENSFEIQSEQGCMLRIPVNSSLTIETVNKDFQLKNFEGDVKIETVNGQLHIKNAQNIEIDTVNGDIFCGQIEGNISIKTGNKDGVFKNIEGHLKVGRIAGNITVSGDIYSMNIEAGNNATLNFSPEYNGKFIAVANKNILCRIPEDIDAHVKLKSDAQNIKIVTDSRKEIIHQSSFEITSEDGIGTIDLTAGGKIEFHTEDSFDYIKSDIAFDLGNEFTEIGNEFSNLANEITQQITSELGGHLESLKGTINSNASKSSRNIKRTVGNKVKNKTRKAIIIAREARGRHQHIPKHKAEAEPIKDEERKLILEMVGTKTISVEQAEMLLQALDGNKPEIPDITDVKNTAPNTESKTDGENESDSTQKE